MGVAGAQPVQQAYPLAFLCSDEADCQSKADAVRNRSSFSME